MQQAGLPKTNKEQEWRAKLGVPQLGVPVQISSKSILWYFMPHWLSCLLMHILAG
jgi:hypothetical protein